MHKWNTNPFDAFLFKTLWSNFLECYPKWTPRLRGKKRTNRVPFNCVSVSMNSKSWGIYTCQASIHKCSWNLGHLTHWPLENVTVILNEWFLDSYQGYISWVFPLKLASGENLFCIKPSTGWLSSVAYKVCLKKIWKMKCKSLTYPVQMWTTQLDYLAPDNQVNVTDSNSHSSRSNLGHISLKIFLLKI